MTKHWEGAVFDEIHGRPAYAVCLTIRQDGEVVRRKAVSVPFVAMLPEAVEELIRWDAESEIPCKACAITREVLGLTAV